MENFHFIIQENFIEGADNFATKSEGIPAAVAERAEDGDSDAGNHTHSC